MPWSCSDVTHGLTAALGIELSQDSGAGEAIGGVGNMTAECCVESATDCCGGSSTEDVAWVLADVRHPAAGWRLAVRAWGRPIINLRFNSTNGPHDLAMGFPRCCAFRVGRLLDGVWLPPATPAAPLFPLYSCSKRMYMGHTQNTPPTILPVLCYLSVP